MIRFQIRPVRCQGCGVRLDRGVPFLREVPPALSWMHSLCDAFPRRTSPEQEGFRREYMDATIAMVTEALGALQEEPGSSPAHLAAVRRVIEEIPHRTQVALSGLVTAMVVDELAKAQERTPQEAWSEIALKAALAFPDEG